MSIIGSAITWWAEYYRSHDLVQFVSALGHILSIGYAARFALGGDRAALRLTSRALATRKHPAPRAVSAGRDIQTITSAHRHVIAGLVFAVLTGIAQLFAQLDYLPQSPIFWLKMTMLAVLLANGRIIQLKGRQLNARLAESGRQQSPGDLHHPLRAAAIRSIMLWCAMILLGLALTTVRPG